MSQSVQEGRRPTLGVLTALPHEFSAMKLMLDNAREHFPDDSVKHIIGEIPSRIRGQHTIVLAIAGKGQSPAAIRTALTLREFDTIKWVFMVGIAGGVPNPSKLEDDVRLGDIVVSDMYGLAQFDAIKLTTGGVEFREAPHRPSATLISSATHLQIESEEGQHPWEEHLARGLTVRGWQRPSDESDFLGATEDGRKRVPRPNDPARRPGQPRVFLGLIASSNTLLKNPVKRDELREQFRAKAVEMETAGLVEAAWTLDKGYLGVRGICDYCDENKNDLWQNYAAMAAAAYVRALLESMPEAGTKNDSSDQGKSGIQRSILRWPRIPGNTDSKNTLSPDSMPSGKSASPPIDGASSQVVTLPLQHPPDDTPTDEQTRCVKERGRDRAVRYRGEEPAFVTPERMDALRDFAVRYIGGPIAPSETLRSWIQINPYIFVVLDDVQHSGQQMVTKIKGYFSARPITKEAADLLESGDLDGAGLLPKHIVKPGRKPYAVYIGGIAGDGQIAQGKVRILLMQKINDYRIQGVRVFYTKPVTNDGLRLARDNAFVKLDLPPEKQRGVFKRVYPNSL